MQQGPHHVAHTVENSLVVFYTVHLCRLEGDVGMAIDAILNEKHERGLFFHNAEIGKLRLCHLGSKLKVAIAVNLYGIVVESFYGSKHVRIAHTFGMTSEVKLLCVDCKCCQQL